MQTPSSLTPAERVVRRWIQIGYLIAALVGSVLGWGVGMQLGGVLMATIMALNSAVFGALLVGAAANLVLRLQRRRNGAR